MLSTLAKFFLVSLFVLMAQVFCSPDASAAKLGPGRYEQTITVDKLVRKFIVFVPASYNYSPTPLVLNFHGSGSNDVQQEAISLMDINATKNGYIVCYPDAVSGHWNDGRVLPGQPLYGDVQFVQALIPFLESEFNIDSKHIYTCGLSNGSLFSMRLAFEMPTTFAAAGVVAGALSQAQYRIYTNKNTAPIPMIIFHGTADPFVPFNGGQITDFVSHTNAGRVYSAFFTNYYWAVHNGDTTQASSEALPIIVPANPTSVTEFNYPGPYPIRFFEEFNTGHTWPGGIQYAPVSEIGYTCYQIDGDEQLWDFFKQFTLGQPL